MPIATPHDLLRAAIHDLTEALKNPKPGLLIGTLQPTEVQALQDLTNILTNKNNEAKQEADNEGLAGQARPLWWRRRVEFTNQY